LQLPHRNTIAKLNEKYLSLECCFLLGVAQYFMYRPNFTQFFQGDAIFWMYRRFHNFSAFFQSLIQLDLLHSYRPLSNRTIPSMFYSFWGLRPYGYHIVVLGLFFLTSCVLFQFVKRLTGRTLVAFLATFYFSIHSTNVYTTFDFAFSPDVLYGLFYICALWFFMECERQHSQMWSVASAACFALSLMSKEAAVTLPPVLVLFHIVFVRPPALTIRAVSSCVTDVLRKIWLQLAVFVMYLVFVVGYLGVVRGSGGYMLVLDNVPGNLLTAVYWALNLKRTGFGPIPLLPRVIVFFLIVFAIVQLAIAMALLFRPERKLLLFGFLWFVTALSPVLMLNRLRPYYLFLPMAGFSLVIGSTLSKTYEYLRTFPAAVSSPVVSLMLLMLWLSCRTVSVPDIVYDGVLGYGPRLAANSAADIMTAHPQLPSGANVYILDESIPELWRYQGAGSLFKLLYNDATITTSYRSLGHSPRATTGDRLVVMKTQGEHLVDVTAAFQKDPQKFITAPDENSLEYEASPGVELQVEPAAVTAGKDFYWITIAGFGAQDVLIQYTIDKGPVADFTVPLNPAGKVRFFVSTFTEPGLYEFLRFKRISGQPSKWIKSSAAIRVSNPSPQ